MKNKYQEARPSYKTQRFSVASLFLLLFITAASLLHAAPGNLMLALHELNDSSETPSTVNVGGTSTSAASALSQKAGTVIMSARIWHNIIHRRLAFAQKAAVSGTHQQKSVTAYKAHRASPSAATKKNLQSILAKKEGSQQALFLWQLPLEQSTWRAFFHAATHLYILIPANEVATSGIATSCLVPVHLPSLNDIPGQQALVSSAYSNSDRGTFSVPKFADILKKDQPRWAIYQNGHGIVPSRDEDSDALLHDRWFSWPSLPRHDVRDPAVQKSLESGRAISGIPLTTFRELLLLFNELNTTAYYYQSCFGSGQNSAIIHQYNKNGSRTSRDDTRLTDRLRFAPSLGLRYPLIAGALTDVTIMRARPSLHTSAPWYYPHDFTTFFNKATSSLRTVGQLHALAAPVTVTTGVNNDPHGISTTPMALLPGATQFVPLDIARGSSENLERPSSSKPGLLVITKASGSQSTPLHITNTRAILAIPSEITTPLVISPYRHVNPLVNTHLPQLPPTLISLPPDDALHRIHDMTLNKIGLRNFMVHSFMHLKSQKNAKAFLIDRLTLDNDLMNNFSLTTGTSSYVSALTGWIPGATKPAASVATGSRITLEKVFIYTANNRLQIYFLHPAADGSLVAKHSNYRTSDAPNLLKPGKDKVFVALHEISNDVHGKLYTHYESQLAAATNLLRN